MMAAECQGKIQYRFVEINATQHTVFMYNFKFSARVCESGSRVCTCSMMSERVRALPARALDSISWPIGRSSAATLLRPRSRLIFALDKHQI